MNAGVIKSESDLSRLNPIPASKLDRALLFQLQIRAHIQDDCDDSDLDRAVKGLTSAATCWSRGLGRHFWVHFNQPRQSI